MSSRGIMDKNSDYSEQLWKNILDDLSYTPRVETQKEKDMKILSTMNIEHIEEFLRNKKLERISNKINGKK